jgi:hypothetical protein
VYQPKYLFCLKLDYPDFELKPLFDGVHASYSYSYIHIHIHTSKVANESTTRAHPNSCGNRARRVPYMAIQTLRQAGSAPISTAWQHFMVETSI